MSARILASVLFLATVVDAVDSTQTKQCYGEIAIVGTQNSAPPICAIAASPGYGTISDPPTPVTLEFIPTGDISTGVFAGTTVISNGIPIQSFFKALTFDGFGPPVTIPGSVAGPGGTGTCTTTVTIHAFEDGFLNSSYFGDHWVSKTGTFSLNGKASPSTSEAVSLVKSLDFADAEVCADVNASAPATNSISADVILRSDANFSNAVVGNVSRELSGSNPVYRAQIYLRSNGDYEQDPPYIDLNNPVGRLCMKVTGTVVTLIFNNQQLVRNLAVLPSGTAGIRAIKAAGTSQPVTIDNFIVKF